MRKCSSLSTTAMISGEIVYKRTQKKIVAFYVKFQSTEQPRPHELYEKEKNATMRKKTGMTHRITYKDYFWMKKFKTFNMKIQ